MRDPLSRQRILTALPAIFLVILLDFLGLFRELDCRLFDLFHQIRGTRSPSDRIVIAAIDERTLQQLGRWPIDRKHYAALLDGLANAAVVAFDIIMGEPSEDDGVLSEAMTRHGRVVLPEYLNPQGEMIRPASSLPPVTAGHIHIEQDVDGITREVYHTIFHRDQMIPSFSSAIFDNLDEGVLPRSSYSPSHDADGERTVPLLLQADPMLINYYGPRETFRHISFVDILGGKWPPGFFKGKIVFVGVTVAGIESELTTSFTGARDRTPGVEVHATILNNLLDGTYYTELDSRWMWPVCIVLSFGYFLLCSARTPGQLVSIWISAVLLLLTLTYWVMVSLHTRIPAAPLLALISAASAAGYVMVLQEMRGSLFQAKKDWEESFDTIEDAIVIHSRDCKIARMNRAAAEKTGASIQEMLKQRCLSLEDPRMDDTSDICERGGGEAGSSDPCGEEFLDPESQRYFELRSIPRREDNGQFCGTVHVLRDITLRKSAEGEQQRLQAMLIQAQKMEAIGTLAGGIAHDFNNILAAIIGYAELALAFGAPSKMVFDSLNGILKAGNRAKDLVGQILNLARPGRQELRPVQVSLVVSEVLKFLRASIPRTIEIRNDLQAGSDVILSDATHLHQIVMNLCANAAHAMGEKGGVLQVSLNEVDLALPDMGLYPDLTPGPYVKLTVADTGSGMEKSVLERIFDPYFTTKAPGEGTGMGLAVVQRIVKTHKGSITVHSEVGRGTVFDVYLPRISAVAESEDAGVSLFPRGHERILFVDDEETLAYVGKEALESLGYEVVDSTNSREALELFLSDPHRFDLVITDQTMPQMVGIELARRLHEVRSDIPVILCTGYSNAVSKEKLEGTAIRAVLLKPVPITQLAQEIRKALDNQ